MRIISGKYAGRQLKTLKSGLVGYRPAMAKVRAALFSSLTCRLHFPDLQIMDLFAGSGSIGIEALSRGAKKATFIEDNLAATKILRQNCENLGILDLIQIYQADVLKFLRSEFPNPYDLIFIDPPYGRDLLKPTLELLSSRKWLAENAFVCAEIEPKINSETCKAPKSWQLIFERRYGQTKILIWQTNPANNSITELTTAISD